MKMRTNGISKEECIDLGHRFWSFAISQGLLPGQVTAWAIKELYEELVNRREILAGGDENARTLSLMDYLVQESEGMLTVFGLSQWYDCGLPQIEMGHKFAAALLASDVTPEALEMVKMPWRAFFIEVPDGLLSLYSNSTDTVVPIRRILVMKIENHPHGEWAYIAHTSGVVTLWRLGVKPKDLLPPNIEGTIRAEILLEQTDEDKRVAQLIGRLIINTCLTVGMAGMMNEKRGPGHETWKKSKQVPGKMKGHIRSFQVGKPVVIDLRDRVASYIRGERSKPDVRTLVRGHFKRQHYGAGNAQIKVIWREPFWRGDEGLPMVAPRPHVIKAD